MSVADQWVYSLDHFPLTTNGWRSYLQGTSGGDMGGTATQLFSVGTQKAGFRQAAHLVFDLQAVGKPPANAYITDCRLRVRASAVNSAGPVFLKASIPYRADLWEPTTAPAGSHASVEGGLDLGDFRVWDASAVQLTTGLSSPGQAEYKFRRSTIDARTYGQAFAVGSTFTLAKADVQLRRSGSSDATASITIEVYACAANDGSDDSATGAKLATSSAVSYNSVSTSAGGSSLTFNFTGADAISLTAGKRYVFFVISTHGASSNLAVFGRAANQFAGGSAVVNRPTGQDSHWGTGLWPAAGDLPTYLNQDGSSILHAPDIGPVVSLTAPDFLTVGQTYDFTGLAPLLQAWVQDAGYAGRDNFGIVLSTTSGTSGVDKDRVGDLVTLVVSWTESQAVGAVG